MRLGAVVRCAKCRDEYSLVPGYTESASVCWRCLHPEARRTSRNEVGADVGGSGCGSDPPVPASLPLPFPCISIPLGGV